MLRISSEKAGSAFGGSATFESALSAANNFTIKEAPRKTQSTEIRNSSPTGVLEQTELTDGPFANSLSESGTHLQQACFPEYLPVSTGNIFTQSNGPTTPVVTVQQPSATQPSIGVAERSEMLQVLTAYLTKPGFVIDHHTHSRSVIFSDGDSPPRMGGFDGGEGGDNATERNKDRAIFTINADDDNGSSVTRDFPQIRDFDASHLRYPDGTKVIDDEIIPLVYRFGPLTTPTGSSVITDLKFWIMVPPPTGTGRVRFWKDQSKDESFPVNTEIVIPKPAVGPASVPTIYVEGYELSQAIDDISISVKIERLTTAGTITLTSVPVKSAVGPIVSSLTAHGQSPYFINGLDSSDGIEAEMKLKTEVYQNPDDDVFYVQNVTLVTNDLPNALALKHFSFHDQLFQIDFNAIQHTALNNNDHFPFLDRSTAQGDPTAPAFDPRTPTGQGETIALDDPFEYTYIDHPSIPGSNDITKAAWHDYFRTFIVIKYLQYNEDGSQRMNVLYCLDYMEWDADFNASEYVVDRGVTSLAGSSTTNWTSYITYHGNDFMTVGAIANGTVVLKDVP